MKRRWHLVAEQLCERRRCTDLLSLVAILQQFGRDLGGRAVIRVEAQHTNATLGCRRRCACRSGVRRRHVELRAALVHLGEQLPETIGDHVGSGVGRRAHEESRARVVDEHLRCGADGVWRQRGAWGMRCMQRGRLRSSSFGYMRVSIVPKGNASRRHLRGHLDLHQEMAGDGRRGWEMAGDGRRGWEMAGDGGRWQEGLGAGGSSRELAGAGPA